MSSLSEQLLKAGLVSEEQVKKAKTSKPKQDLKRHKKKPKKKKPESDLAKFYGERRQLERREQQEAKRKKEEEVRIKKETNKKIAKLIKNNLLNDESADIRFNFVVGTSIKYLFVTQQQQQDLIDGKLAFTFLGGSRCLIPLEIAKKIEALNPHKLVIIPGQ